MKVNFLISYELSVMNLSFQVYNCRVSFGKLRIHIHIVFFIVQLFNCFLPPFSEILIKLRLSLLCHIHMYVVCVVEDGIQLAFQNRLIALLLFNCPFQLSHSKMESEEEINSEFKAIELSIPIYTSLLHHLSHY